MWTAVYPTSGERDALRGALSEARRHAYAVLPSLGGALDSPDGMEAIRSAVGHLRAGDPHTDAISLTAAIPVFSAAWARGRSGQPPVSPKPGLSHAADFLQMLDGAMPESARVAALDAYLCASSITA